MKLLIIMAVMSILCAGCSGSHQSIRRGHEQAGLEQGVVCWSGNKNYSATVTLPTWKPFELPGLYTITVFDNTTKKSRIYPSNPASYDHEYFSHIKNLRWDDEAKRFYFEAHTEFVNLIQKRGFIKKGTWYIDTDTWRLEFKR
ncbi:MAG: hypothetical protein GF384_03110 [Elusimicrobia bacterium]|nr:hypothetical protein [Elusimicrobiota bacterium]MBD3411922.1 hypothetical protein [Elusimicrobiota bacterium]